MNKTYYLNLATHAVVVFSNNHYTDLLNGYIEDVAPADLVELISFLDNSKIMEGPLWNDAIIVKHTLVDGILLSPGTKCFWNSLFGIGFSSVRVSAQISVPEELPRTIEVFVPKENIYLIPTPEMFLPPVLQMGDKIFAGAKLRRFSNQTVIGTFQNYKEDDPTLITIFDNYGEYREFPAKYACKLPNEAGELAIGDKVAVVGYPENCSVYFCGARGTVLKIEESPSLSFVSVHLVSGRIEKFPSHCVFKAAPVIGDLPPEVPVYKPGEFVKTIQNPIRYCSVYRPQTKGICHLKIIAHTEGEAVGLKYANIPSYKLERFTSIPEDCFVKCAFCGTWHKISEMESDQSSGIFHYEQYCCKDCRSTGIELCPQCGHWHHKWEFVTVNPGYEDAKSICAPCAQETFRLCAFCNSYFSKEHMSQHIPNACIRHEDNFAQCNRCHEWFLKDALLYDEDDGLHLCHSCDERARECSHVHSYGYKPASIFYRHPHQETDGDFIYPADSSSHVNGANLYMGVELEIDKGENRDRLSHKLYQAIGEHLIYQKSDGSLSEDGIELVSHPCTLNYHLHKLGWDRIFALASQYGYQSHDAGTCGLHVHINRTFLGANPNEININLAKIIIIFTRYWDTLVRFSRRTTDQLEWCKKYNLVLESSSSPNKELEFSQKLLESYPKEDHNDRYYAINLINQDTIEFRIFRGTLNPQTFRASLQLIHNLIYYVKAHSINDCLDCSFNDWACLTPYPELVKYLKHSGISNPCADSIPFLPNPIFQEGDSVKLNELFIHNNSFRLRPRLDKSLLSRCDWEIKHVRYNFYHNAKKYNSYHCYDLHVTVCRDENGEEIPIPCTLEATFIVPEAMLSAI